MNAASSASSWPRMSSTRKEPPGRSTRATSRSAGSSVGEVVGGDAARHGPEARLPEGQGLDVGGQEADRPSRPAAAASWRAARSIGSVRSAATTLSVKPAKASAVWPPPVAMSSTRAGARRRAPLDQPFQIRAGGVTRARDVGGGARPNWAWTRPSGPRSRPGPDPRWARWRTRNSASSGVRSKRRLASSTSVARSASGRSRSCSSIHFTRP